MTKPSATVLFSSVLSLASAVQSQNATLSVLGSWQPDTLFHVGVSCPDKTFSVCRLFVSAQAPAVPLILQGVRVVVDPMTMVELPIFSQFGAEPTSTASTEAKWRFDTKLPGTLVSGAPIHVQAVLLDSVGKYRLTNGVVGQVAAVGAHEIRYALSNASTSFALRRYDIDRGVPLGAVSFPKRTNAGDPSEPVLSPDQSLCVLNFGAATSQVNGETCIVDLKTMTATWLPALVGSRATRVRPQFRPGQSDRFWVVESKLNWQYFFSNSSVSDFNSDLVCFDSNPASPTYGRALSRVAINADSGPVLSTGHTNLEAEWSLDPTGTWACFVEHQTYNKGLPVGSWFTRYAVNSSVPIRTGLATRPSWSNAFVRPTRDGDVVAFSDCTATGWNVRTAHASNGALQNSQPSVVWSIPLGAIAGGTLWTAKQAPLVVMATSPAAGLLGSFTCPTGDWTSYRGIEDNGGGVVLAGPEAYHARPICRVRLNGLGQAVREDVYCGLAPYAKHYGAYQDGPAWGGAPSGTRGRGVALAQRRGALLLVWNVGTGVTTEGVCLLDTETMTHVSMQPSLTPEFARALAQNGAYINYLF